jgi:hypothetical protein
MLLYSTPQFRKTFCQTAIFASLQSRNILCTMPVPEVCTRFFEKFVVARSSSEGNFFQSFSWRSSPDRAMASSLGFI